MIDWEPTPPQPRGHDVDDDDAVNEWNPMHEDSTSIRNKTSGGQVFEDVAALGDVFCPFQKEMDKVCFKGSSCRYKHGHYTSEIKSAHPKLQDRPTSSLILAKSESAPLPEGVVALAWVTSVVSPALFHVVLKTPQHPCLCKNMAISQEDEQDVTPHGHISPHSSDLTSSLDVLWRNMQSYYNSNPTGRQQNHNFHHFRGELVAVRLNLGGEKATSGIISGHRKGWFRAVVLADTDPDLDADQAPDVSLELVDYGAKVTKSSLDVTPLHDKFADDAPMAIKCSLYGISPLLGKWGSRGTDFFTRAVTNQIVLLEVKKSQPSLPVQVSLCVKMDGVMVPVTQRMGELGLGLEWNMTPMRPWVTSDVLQGPHRHSYAVKPVDTMTPQEQEALAKKITTQVIAEERKRLSWYILNNFGK
ncbi:uncharacterized protein LOC110848778 isoform X2 [Folsomia candida]|uniref:uncharacterized protein LOC110848778 isoform X2 n=1 Tax=Folsomia candida TaxID=158441 RepID=UPI001604F2F4|nr:uncharacterized protein LOC110848778 isoform X2 [Folsomia candida]